MLSAAGGWLFRPIIPTPPLKLERRGFWSKPWVGAVVGDLGLEGTEGTLGRGNRKSACKTQEHGPWCGKSRDTC